MLLCETLWLDVQITESFTFQLIEAQAWGLETNVNKLANVIIEAQSVSLIDIACDMKACTFTDKPREVTSCCTDRMTNKNIPTTPIILWSYLQNPTVELHVSCGMQNLYLQGSRN